MSNSLIRRGLDLLADDLQLQPGKGKGKKAKSQVTAKSQVKIQKQKPRNSLKNKKLKSTRAIYDAHRKTDHTDENLSMINYLKIIDTGSKRLINQELKRHSYKIGIPVEKRQPKPAASTSSAFTDKDFNNFLSDFDFDSLKTLPNDSML